MSGPWFRICTDLLNDPIAQRMHPEDFKAAFYAAVREGTGPLTAFVRPCHGRPPAHEWAEMRAAVFARDGYACTYCGAHGGRLECDHVIPVSRGGPSVMSNLTTACFACNRSKRHKTPQEWRAN